MKQILLVILLVVLYLVTLVRQRMDLPEIQRSVLFGIEVLLAVAFMFSLGNILIENALVTNYNLAMGIALVIMTVFLFCARKLSRINN